MYGDRIIVGNALMRYTKRTRRTTKKFYCTVDPSPAGTTLICFVLQVWIHYKERFCAVST